MASLSVGPPGRGAIHRRHLSDFDDASHLFEKFRLPQYPVFRVPPPPRRGFGRSALPCGARDNFTRFRPCCQELFLESFELFLARSFGSNLPKLLPQARASLSHTGPAEAARIYYASFTFETPRIRRSTNSAHRHNQIEVKPQVVVFGVLASPTTLLRMAPMVTVSALSALAFSLRSRARTLSGAALPESFLTA